MSSTDEKDHHDKMSVNVEGTNLGDEKKTNRADDENKKPEVDKEKKTDIPLKKKKSSTSCDINPDAVNLKSHDDHSGESTEGKNVVQKNGDNKKTYVSFFSKHSFLRQNLLTILTLLAVIVGLGLGFALKKAKKWTKREVMYISYPGEIFLRMLKGLILPLIVSSLISALGSLDVKLSGKIGVRALVYYLGTTLLAIILGIILVVIIRPGVGHKSDDDVVKKKAPPSLTADTLLDLVRNMFPPNIMEATITKYSTSLIQPKYPNGSINYEKKDISTWALKLQTKSGSNILGLVVFSIVLGIILGRMQNQGKPLLIVFKSLSDSMMILTKLIIWLSPIGVLFLVCGKIVEMSDFGEMVSKVGLYTGTVLIGLFIHGLIVLPLIYFILLRKLPFIFIANMSQALATAFGTSSSSATLPITIACLEEKNHIDARISRFCLPVGATINMDGTALYEAVAAIFIAQVRKVSLSLGSIIGISITATAASVGAAGIPQAGLVTMVMVLNVVGLPADDIMLILVVDWFLDRFRTTVNVLGDAIGSGIIEHFSLHDLETLDHVDIDTAVARVSSRY